MTFIRRHKVDFIIICIAMITAGLLFLYIKLFYLQEGSNVEVTIDGKVIETYPLDTDKVFTIENDGNYNKIRISGGKVSVIDSSCNNKICVEHSSISKVGESIICLPNHLVIRITGKDCTDNTVDDIAR